MKKNIFFGILFLVINIPIFAQKVTETWLAEKFGSRFISASEAGVDQKLSIPFTEMDLKYDRISWLMPINIDGIVQYCLIRALYLPNPYVQYDTLSLNEAMDVFWVTNRAGRAFPNTEKVRFFLTKDRVIMNHSRDLTFRLVLACDSADFSVVSLRANTQIASWNGSSAYLNGSNGSVDSIIIGSGKTGPEKIGKVMTLVRLIKSD